MVKELVQQGYQVRALKRSASLPSFIPSSIFEKVEWVDGDILDVVSLEDAMQGVDAVIHAAAVVSFDPDKRKTLFKVNIEGTANVVNAALEANVRRFVYISSVAALGRTAKESKVTEEKKWTKSKSNTHYAISKYFAEMEVWRAMGEGMEVMILNPSTILGFGNWEHSSCEIFKTVYNEFPWYTEGVNGFVDVEDVAKVTVALMRSPVSNERFIVSGENWSIRQLMNSIAGNFGKKKPSKNATPFLMKIAWRLEKLKSKFTGKKPLLTKQSARVAQSKTYFDNTKLLNALPDFSFTPLSQTIEKACNQYKQQLPSS
ncbi:MAG: NAD-dependent epimerase/dehydratase family protein [Chitinophagaceae bacterium]|nr:NAD-dependent epimerase/dehydratase family protein [Chitinophagaceae bacterium]